MSQSPSVSTHQTEASVLSRLSLAFSIPQTKRGCYASQSTGTARTLERRNDASALGLANHILRRVLWVNIDFSPTFREARQRSWKFAEKYDEFFKAAFPEGANGKIDLVGFSLALFYGFSVPVDEEFAMQARRFLNSWIQIERIERRLFEKNTEDHRSIDIVGGIDELVTEIRAMGTDAGKG